MTEDVRASPGIKTGSDYFFHARRSMEQSNINYSFEDEYTKRTIDNVVFDEMDVTMEFNGKLTRQSYLAARLGNKVVALIESYSAPEEQTETSAILSTLKFGD